MSTSETNRAEAESVELRKALDAESEACIDLRRQLDQANLAFEEFVSTAAHNMREPLREIASFSELLAANCAADLDSESLMMLSHIREGAAGIQALLADILDYWSVGVGDRRFYRTDMEAVLIQALFSEVTHIAARDAIVSHDPLPQVDGDFEALTKILRHLIQNAIEYCVPTAPRIHISCRQLDTEWVFSVQDNGPGIDPAFHARVFGPFKRLHGREFPGTGLGLAFCKKAIEWQGGRMWLESTPGSGSTFFFTLPASD
jgi:light-regulated signal transduction histidine kinase (bacteriophytochrome)